MKREPGFYWVRTKDGWSVAEFRISKYIEGYSFWCVLSSIRKRQDKDFFEIDERRIMKD